MLKLVTCCTLLLATSIVLAHGGGGGGAEPRAQSNSNRTSYVSPEQMVVDNYREGKKLLAAAVKMEQQANGTWKDKKRAKLHKKAVKQFKEAIEKFSYTIHYDSTFAPAYSGMGYALCEIGEHSKALTSYDMALKLKPRSAQTLADRANTYLRMGRLQDSRTAYDQLKKVDASKARELIEALRQWQQLLADNSSMPGQDEILEFEQWLSSKS